MWTLNDALQECARNTYNTKTMIRTSAGYAGKGLEYVNRFLSGINYAIRKIAREKAGVMHTEDVTTDNYGEYALDSLTYPCIRVKGVKCNNYPVQFNVSNNEILGTPGLLDSVVSVTYQYLPTDLTLADLDTTLPINQKFIDPMVLCQYANYQFLSEEGTEYDTARAQVWLGLFTDSFENIYTPASTPRQVRYNG